MYWEKARNLNVFIRYMENVDIAHLYRTDAPCGSTLISQPKL